MFAERFNLPVINMNEKEVRRMHLMIKTVYPPDKAVDVGKVFVKSVGNPLPAGVKRIESYTVVTEQGIEAYTIYRIKDEKYAAAIKELQGRMIGFHDIVGLRYKITPVMTAAEALPLIQIQPPEYKT